MNRNGRRGAPLAAAQEGALGLLIEVFRDAPRLPRALCAGEPETWDARDGRREDVERAKRVCGYCSELQACEAYTAGRKGLSGVWAGHFHRTKTEGKEHDNS
ncbi:hypothetical protein BH10ACT9_BH10ACT9_18120 [soil metagenome]